MVEQKGNQGTYTYLAKGENDGLNERTQKVTANYADNPELANQIMDE